MSTNKKFNYLTALDKHKSLKEIFFAAGEIETNSFNNYVFLLSIILFLAIGISGIAFSIESQTNLLFPFLVSAAKLIYSYAIGIVGFLIAGLAILISIDRGDLFLLMARSQYKKSDFSNFHFLFFTCIRTLVFHLILLAITLCVTIIGDGGQAFSIAVQDLISLPYSAAVTINAVLLVIILSLCVRCILVVKSFVYNIYQSVVVSLLISDYRDKNPVESQDSEQG